MAGFAGTALSALLPVEPKGTREFLLLDGLRSIAPPPDGRVVVHESVPLRGRTLLEQEDVPLAVESTLGAGRVTFLAFDVSKDPFASWKEAPTLWTWLWGPALPPEPTPESPLRRGPRAVGCLPLVQRALEFPDVEPPRIRGLFLAIVLYVVVVGPFDYLLLRILKRHEWTWLTFPLYVAGFTALILASGGAFIQRAAVQREIGVIDVHGDTSRARILSALLPPSDGEYALHDGALPVSASYRSRAFTDEVMGDLKDARVDLSTTPGRTTWTLTRLQGALAMLDAPAPSPAGLTFAVEGAGDQLRLAVDNRSGAYATAFLATSSGVYFIGAIEPGRSTLEASRHYSSLDAFVRTHGTSPAGTSGDEAARRTLVALTFNRDRGGEDPRELTEGLARRMNARSFVEAGGRLLLAWPKSTGPGVVHVPEPTRRSSVLLHRFFQEPGP
jgi:hypothetical protein